MLILLRTLLLKRRVLLDKPNERSLHSVPTPRVGGLALMPGVAAGWSCLGGTIPWVVWLPAFALFGLSFLDDALDLRVSVRLIMHLLAGFAIAYAIVLPSVGWLSALCAMFAIAWMTNLYNFMDGSDGLAGGMALIGFSGYAIAAFITGAPLFGLACLVIVAASGAFLRYNFHPAQVFLGDAGSVPLGFVAAALGALGWNAGIWPFWFPLLVFSPFVVDASATLVRRALRREKLWRAHREHYYQRLVRLGWGHRRTALAEYILMVGCSAAGLIGIVLPLGWQLVLLGIGAMTYSALMYAIDRAWAQYGESSR